MGKIYTSRLSFVLDALAASEPRPGRARGALMRDLPNGEVVGSYVDGTLLIVIPGTVEQDGVVWVHVLAPDGVEGWMNQSVLATATPAPNWGG